MNHTRHIRKRADLVLVVAFALALLLPTFGSLCHFQKPKAIDEYRLLAAFPGFGAGAVHLQVFAKQFETYYNDHFGGREQLIICYLKIKYAWFSSDMGPRVLLGRDGWLYYSAEGMIDNHRGTAKFTLQQLKAWQVLLEKRRDWLAARGIKYLFVIAPNKESIYPDHLPRWLDQPSATKLDQFVGYMRLHSTVEILDLRPALWEARKRNPVYYKTDSHWNLMGGFVAYDAIILKVSHQIPELNPVALENFDIQRERGPGGDLARLGGTPTVMDDNIYVFAPKMQLPKLEFHASDTNVIDYRRLGNLPVPSATITTTNSRHDTHAIVFGDSFAPALVPFLGNHFGKVVFFDKEDFNPEVISQDKPVIVINEMAERRFNGADPFSQLRKGKLEVR
jgi:hypothetical protein